MKTVTRWAVWAGALVVSTEPLLAQHPDTTGTGWTLATLDLSVAVHPAEARIGLGADLELTLEGHERSSVIVLVMNSRDTIMMFDSVTTDRGQVTAMNAPLAGRPTVRAAHIVFPQAPAERGDRVRVRVHASSSTTTDQFTLAEDVALASWVTAWYPVPLPDSGTSLGSVAKAPGRTEFDLPAAWRAVSNGARVDRVTRGERSIERWVTEQPLARSFTAAPYRMIERDVDGRTVALFLLTVSDTEGEEQANALAGVIDALEERFGPYPTESYAIAEVPEWVPGFLAASEEGFMMAKPENFRVAGGNIPLFAHEAAHGYWGNRVSSSGPGSAFLSESIAQYGAVLALERLLGWGAAIDFLKYSREGYIPLQSARGYFEVIRRGADSVPIAELRDLRGIAKRIVVDSKGTWVYHMLRHRLGDERFFAVLRSYLETHSDGTSTLDAFRAAVRHAAPDEDTEQFFAQWLDRAGAPVLHVSWTEGDGYVDVVIDQTQGGDAYTLDFDVLVEEVGEVRHVHTVRLDRQRQSYRFATDGHVTGVTVDPDFRILRWDESYRTEPR